MVSKGRADIVNNATPPGKHTGEPVNVNAKKLHLSVLMAKAKQTTMALGLVNTVTPCFARQTSMVAITQLKTQKVYAPNNV